MAALLGNVEAVRDLLSSKTALRQSCVQQVFWLDANAGNAELVKLLLTSSVDFYAKNKDGKTASATATERRYTEVTQIFSAYERVNNALILACKCLHVERVNRFLKKNVNLNFKDELGNTALMYVREAFCKDEDACTRRNEIEELFGMCIACDKLNGYTYNIEHSLKMFPLRSFFGLT